MTKDHSNYPTEVQSRLISRIVANLRFRQVIVGLYKTAMFQLFFVDAQSRHPYIPTECVGVLGLQFVGLQFVGRCSHVPT